ncbi:MAG TPA: hypothetical protein VGB99_16135 [Acidobacteriota bacterium]
MVPEFRDRFNRRFRAADYERFLGRLEAEVGAPITFRQAETPVFVPQSLAQQMVAAAQELLAQSVEPAYLKLAEQAIPPAYRVEDPSRHPTFAVVDFAVTRDDAGALVPKLIELQGFPSLYGYLPLSARAYRDSFGIDAGLPYLLGGLDEARYGALLRRTILGRHPPERVVLLEIQPWQQKTSPDFHSVRQYCPGLAVVCATDVKRRGRRLWYRAGGREIPIARIYNRVIVDDLERRGLQLDFQLGGDYDVEWADRPTWYFRISKFTLPFLRHSLVPRAWRLSELDRPPPQLERYVLKPLFSFAGAGVQVEVSAEMLAAIAPAQRANYLLQEKVDYAPVLCAPDGGVKVELRVLCLWPDELIAVALLPRLSRGAMLGVDFNKGKTWVGSSASFIVPG